MYLLDTNALIIALRGHLADSKLTEPSMEILRTERELYVSVIALWEMAIKVRIGKLALDCSISDIAKECEQVGITILPMKIEYIDKTTELPLMDDHKDAFDRFMISVAAVEGMTLITTDGKIRSHDYGIEVVW